MAGNGIPVELTSLLKADFTSSGDFCSSEVSLFSKGLPHTMQILALLAFKQKQLGQESSLSLGLAGPWSTLVVVVSFLLFLGGNLGGISAGRHYMLIFFLE